MTEKKSIPTVNFRFLGDPVLGPALAARIEDRNSGAEATAAVREHLARYFVLLDRELRGLNFSRGEIMALLDATNGWFVTPDSVPYLHAEVEDALEDGLGEKWSVDGPALVARLKALSLGARFALVDALERTRRTAGEHGGDLERSAVAAGLLRGVAEAGRNL